MVYRKYIKRGGQKFGPYYFKSVRDKDGNVRSIYLGKSLEQEKACRETIPRRNDFKRVSFFILIFVLVFGGIIFFKNYVGFSIFEFDSGTYLPGEVLTGDVKLTIQYNEFIPKNAYLIASLHNQSSEMSFSDFVEKSGSGLESGIGNFSGAGIDLNESGEGYGVDNDQLLSLNISEFGLVAPLDVGNYELIIILGYKGVEISRLEETILVQQNVVSVMRNNKPVFLEMPNQSWLQDTENTLDLSKYSYDPDNDTLRFDAIAVDGVSINVEGSLLTFIPNKGFVGKRTVTITAFDDIDSTSIVLSFEVVPKAVSKQIGNLSKLDINLTKESQKGNITLEKELTEAERLSILNVNVGKDKVRFKNLIKKGEDYDLELEFDTSIVNKGFVEINGLNDTLEIENVSIVESAGFITPILAINSINISNATIKLPKFKTETATTILKCNSFDFDSSTCYFGWEDADIPFQQDNKYVWFTVENFSGWTAGGGQVYDPFELDGSTNYCATGNLSGTDWYSATCDSGAGNFTLQTGNHCFMDEDSRVDNSGNKRCGNVTSLNSGVAANEQVHVSDNLGSGGAGNLSSRVYFQVDCNNNVTVPAGADNYLALIGYANTSGSMQLFLGFDQNEKLGCGGRGNGAIKYFCSGQTLQTINCGEWYYAEIAFNQNADNLTCWLNGSVFCSEQGAHAMLNTRFAALGKVETTSSAATGTIYVDEFRSVVGSNGFKYIGGYPNISNPKELYDKIATNRDQQLNYTIQDFDNDLGTVWITINNTINYTITSKNGNEYYFDFDNGNYSSGGNVFNYTWYANDSNGQLIRSATFNFTVNKIPTHNNPAITSTSNNNVTTDDLTLTNQSTSDGDNDNVTNIYHFYKNGVSYSNLLMSFDTGDNVSVTDYSGYGNAGTIENSAVWTNNGKVGGAYNFSGDSNARVMINAANSLTPVASMTLEAFIFWEKSTCSNADIAAKTSIAVGQDSFKLSVNSSCNVRFTLWDTSNSPITIGSTSTLSNRWYHVAGVFNGSDMKLYIDGVEENNASFTSNIDNNNIGMYIGDISTATTSGNFNGSIDEVRFYNISLSKEQIVQHNNTNFNKIVANDTVKGQQWIGEVIPNDGYEDGTYKNSTVLTILNSAPSQVTLSSPADASSTNDRTPTFTWNAATDNDGDSLTYNITVDNNADFSSPAVNVNSISAITYTLTNDLELVNGANTIYYWKVLANDGSIDGAWSSTRQFTLTSEVSMSLPNDTSDFGNMAQGAYDDTLDSVPSPILVQNDGNTFIDVNVSLLSGLWVTQTSPTTYFRYLIANYTGEAGAFNWSGSQTTWSNVPTSNNTAVDYLNYTDASDVARFDINVTVPPDESAGSKAAVLSFIAWFGE